VHALLACIIVGGLVLDTSIDSISASFKAQKKAAKAAASSKSLTGGLDVTSAGWGDKFSFNALRGR
jgi:AP-3 complex subunit sigma